MFNDNNLFIAPLNLKDPVICKDSSFNLTVELFDAVSDIVAQSRGYRYSKYYGLLLVDAIQGISDVNKKNECVKDLYLYASSQHVDSGFHIKLQ